MNVIPAKAQDVTRGLFEVAAEKVAASFAPIVVVDLESGDEADEIGRAVIEITDLMASAFLRKGVYLMRGLYDAGVAPLMTSRECLHTVADRFWGLSTAARSAEEEVADAGRVIARGPSALDPGIEVLDGFARELAEALLPILGSESKALGATAIAFVKEGVRMLKRCPPATRFGLHMRIDVFWLGETTGRKP